MDGVIMNRASADIHSFRYQLQWGGWNRTSPGSAISQTKSGLLHGTHQIKAIVTTPLVEVHIPKR